MASIEEKVEHLLKDKIEKAGYDLYDVEYAKEGKNYFLRIFIDKPEGIDLSDCEKVNDEINDLLDEANYIKDQYFLEISSPGIERILRKEKHLEDNIGQKVCVNLFKPIEKEKQLIGTLQKFDKDSLYISCKDSEGTIKIERKNISLIKTVYEWD